jgi:hypothetical protein
MTKTQEWADELNGIQYPADGIDRQSKAIALDGQIVVYGMSDDLLEFTGAINDEVGAWNGAKVKLTDKPDIFDEELNRDSFEYNSSEISNMKTVEAVWGPKDSLGKIWAGWEIKTDIPHETFDIMEDDDLFCRGIVFDAKWLTGEKL